MLTLIGPRLDPEEPKKRTLATKTVVALVASHLAVGAIAGVAMFVIANRETPEPAQAPSETTPVASAEVQKKDSVATAPGNSTAAEAASREESPGAAAPEANAETTEEMRDAVRKPVAETHREKAEAAATTTAGLASEPATDSLAKLLDEGFKALDKANFADAERMFDEATRLDAHAAKAWYGLGKVAYEKGQYTLAAERLEIALKYDRRAKWRVELGNVYLLGGQRDKAIREWQSVIEKYPNDDAAQQTARELLAKNGAPVPE